MAVLRSYISYPAFRYVFEEKWKWQEEWRYIVKFARMWALRRKADGIGTWYDVPFDYYDLIIDRDKLKQIKITLSPVITNEAKRKVLDCVHRYVPRATVESSCLNGIEY